MRRTHTLAVLAVATLAAIAAMTEGVAVAVAKPPAAAAAAEGTAAGSPPQVQSPQDLQASAGAFKQMATVLRHPRCMNCHTVTDFPRQGDDRHRHQQLVMRGVANMGAPTMQCFACHQAHNTHDGRVPGAPNWHLAPLSMGWEDLPTDHALCEALKDPSRNGNKDVEHLVEHMTSDALVQWAWSPGTRVPPTLSREDFHRVVRLWARTGAACPLE